jgi:hypothetical protein
VNWSTFGFGFVIGVIIGLVSASKQETHAKVTVGVFLFGVYAVGVGATEELPTVGNPIDEGTELWHNIGAVVAQSAFIVGLVGMALGLGVVAGGKYVASQRPGRPHD